jgi:iron complex outermembrane receptor protein
MRIKGQCGLVVRQIGVIGAMQLLTVATWASDDTSKASAVEDLRLEEIVVTAQFREQGLQKTPLALTAIDAQTLEAKHQQNVSDLASGAPSVTIQPGSAAWGPTPAISIRGIGAYDFNFALEPGVGVYIDDVYQPTLASSAIDLLDLQRVEILRGPQGTLEGKNAEGGAIKLFSKLPTNELSGFLEAGYGSYNEEQIRGAVNLPLIADQLFLRLAATRHTEDGYVTRYDYGCLNPTSGIPATISSSDCKLGEEGGFNHEGERGTLRWVPNDALSVNIAYDTSRDRDETSASVLLQAINPRGQPTTNYPEFITSQRFVNYATFCVPELGYCIPPVSDSNDWGVASTIDYTFSPTVSLKSITGYRDYSAQFSTDASDGPLTAQLLYNQLAFISFTQELRLNATFGRFDWTLGGFYYRGSGTQGGRNDLGYTGPFPIVTDFNQDDQVHSGSTAEFGQALYHFTDQLTFDVGLRYTREHKDYLFGRTANTPAALLNAAVNGATESYQGSRPDYRASVDYAWTPGIVTYASFSTGFRGGGVNPRPFDLSQLRSFDAETLKNYEVGMKNFFFDRRLRLNADVYFEQYDAIQESITTGYGDFPISAIPLNVGTAHIKGAEFEFEAKPVSALRFDGSVSFLDFNFTELAPSAIASGIRFGMVPEYSPKWKGNFGVQYEIPVQQYGSLTPRLDVTSQSSMYANPVNASTNYLPGYTVSNARLSWLAPGSGKWQVALNVTNLFDRYYLVRQDDLLHQIGTVVGTPARPRTYFVTVNTQF